MYSFKSTVRYSELDNTAQLSPFALVNYLQDIAIMHTEDATGGIAALREEGYAFYITTWQIHIFEMPVYNEQIEVTTWVYKMRGLLSHRAFRITGQDGRRLVEADSTWFLNDVNTNQPIHVPQHIVDMYQPGQDPRPDIPKASRSIKLEGSARSAAPIEIHPMHLDTNGHVNNARYVELALNAAAEAAPEHISHIDVQYRVAATLGDVMHPAIYAQEDAVVVDLAAGDDSSFALVKFYRDNSSQKSTTH